ncbi:transposase [Kitasatospora sp. NPDC008050]|uniref:IS701 family transposase n=1 Tax=Kitasatospora sp. NPDC008050 TaxID=3364021 RepID=UPI0036F0D678
MSATAWGSSTEEIAQELCERLFSSVGRADYRIKAAEYLRGLLGTPGRKSIRNMARSLQDHGANQRLHHFVCNSPWQWDAVRRSLAARLVEVSAPRAWLVGAMPLAKSGARLGGRVAAAPAGHGGPGPHPAAGREPFDGDQQALGLWYAAPGLTAPVAWQLQSAGAPAAPAIDALLRPLRAQLAATPSATLLWDGAPVQPGALFEAGRRLGLRVAVRIAAATRLTVPAAPGHGRPEPLAAQLLGCSPGARLLPGSHAPPGVQARVVRVALPHAAPGRPGDDLFLYSECGPRALPGSGFWLTNTEPIRAHDFHRLIQLADEVERDRAGTVRRAGLRDFEGKSEPGWHRHMTLASAAYAALALGRYPHRIGR